MLDLICPHCGSAMQIAEQYAGHRGRCKDCGGRVFVSVEGEIEPYVEPPAAVEAAQPAQKVPEREPDVVLRVLLAIGAFCLLVSVLASLIGFALTADKSPAPTPQAAEPTEQTVVQPRTAAPVVSKPQPTPKRRPVSKPKPKPDAPMPAYEVVDRDKYDAPIKTQITLSAVVSGTLSEAGLKRLLRKLYDEARATRGFKYHGGRPTHVFIWLYTSRDHFKSGMGQWVGMLSKTGENSRVDIKVKAALISQLDTKPEVKHGLPESKRIEIFRASVTAEDRANADAERRHPLPDPLSRGYSQAKANAQVMKQAEARSELMEKYNAEVARRYGITEEQRRSISLEATKKNWPILPPRQKPTPQVNRSRTNSGKATTTSASTPQAAKPGDSSKQIVGRWRSVATNPRFNPNNVVMDYQTYDFYEDGRVIWISRDKFQGERREDGTYRYDTTKSLFVLSFDRGKAGKQEQHWRILLGGRAEYCYWKNLTLGRERTEDESFIQEGSREFNRREKIYLNK